MLVHEAVAHLAGRAPRFGDPEDIEAGRLLTLYAQAVAAANRRLKVPEHLKKKPEELQQADAAALEAFLHPARKRQKRSGHGD